MPSISIPRYQHTCSHTDSNGLPFSRDTLGSNDQTNNYAQRYHSAIILWYHRRQFVTCRVTSTAYGLSVRLANTKGPLCHELPPLLSHDPPADQGQQIIRGLKRYTFKKEENNPCRRA